MTGELVARQPCIQEVANPDSVRNLFLSLDGNTTHKAGQMAWTLLFYALWYRYHIDGVSSSDGNVFDSLSAVN